MFVLLLLIFNINKIALYSMNCKKFKALMDIHKIHLSDDARIDTYTAKNSALLVFIKSE